MTTMLLLLALLIALFHKSGLGDAFDEVELHSSNEQGRWERLEG